MYNKKHLKNVGPIRHCEPPHALILHRHSPGVATVARRLRIDVHDNNYNAWQRGPLWPHRTGPMTDKKSEKSYIDPSGRMIFTVRRSTTWSSNTWSTNFITSAYLSPEHQTLFLVKIRSIWKMLGPFATTSRFTSIHQMSLEVLSRAACASMSTTTTTTRDRGDRYGCIEWAKWTAATTTILWQS